MIAGHLQIKNDNYYMVLNYTDANGKRRQPWIPTGLPAKGNKRRAEKLLLDTRKSFVPPVVSKENEDISSDMLFADYMELWLEIIRSSVEKTTFSSYTQMVKRKIAPYFRNTGLTLDGIQAKHIQSFYLHELKTVSPGTVIHYHANIHKALKYAVKMDLIPFNPADKVERPKKQRYIADYYRQEELERLLEASKDHPYSLLIQMTAFYGLRRSEALGLKWDAIDFERDTITIKHIVTNAKIDGKCEIVCADRAKTKSSLRSLPLVSNIREKLLQTYRKAGLESPATDDVLAAFPQNEKTDAKQVLESLVTGGDLVMLCPQICWYKDVYAQVCQTVKEHFAKEETLTLAQLRDLLGSSRKYTLAVLEYFDKNRITKKDGDLRRLVGFRD